MRLFDGYVAVDWSASGIPKRGKDSIWIAIRGWSGTEEPENPETRAKAVVRMVKSRVVCKSERKLLDASVRLPWRPPSVREA